MYLLINRIFYILTIIYFLSHRLIKYRFELSKVSLAAIPILDQLNNVLVYLEFHIFNLTEGLFEPYNEFTMLTGYLSQPPLVWYNV